MKIKVCLLVRPRMLNAKLSENFLSPDQNWANFGGFGDLGSGVSKSYDFYSKRHVLAWIHVVWAILRQNRSWGVTSRSVGEKNRESHRGSHRKDMSPLTQGLNYRSACDYWRKHVQIRGRVKMLGGAGLRACGATVIMEFMGAAKAVCSVRVSRVFFSR